MNTVSISMVRVCVVRWIAIAVIALLAIVGLMRAYAFVDDGLPLREAVGEGRWFELANRTHLIPLLTPLSGGPIDGLDVPAALADIDLAWLVAQVRYACPASSVQLRGVSAVLKAGGEVRRIAVAPACEAHVAEFLRGPLEIIGPSPSERAAGLVRFTLGLVLFWLVGRVVLGGDSTEARSRSGLERVPLDLAVGWALLSLLGTAVVLIGFEPAWVLWLGLAGVGYAHVRGKRREVGFPRLRVPDARKANFGFGSAEAAWVVSGALLLLALAKSWSTAIWSWDHHFIWGLKARQLASNTRYFLEADGGDPLQPGYPIGLPVSWALSSLGAVPEALDFHLQWILYGLLIGSFVVRLLATSGGMVQAVSVGLVCTSPLLWDMEGLGLAELPLAVFAVGALVAAESRVARPWLGSLICLGMVVSLKSEGVVVALALLPVVWTLLRRGEHASMTQKRSVMLAFPAAIVAVLVTTKLLTVSSPTFFSGDLVDRLLSRAAEPWAILHPALEQLWHPGWFGLWILAPLACLLAVKSVVQGGLAQRGQVVAGLWLLAAVAAVVLVYLGVYFATYDDPNIHILSSWHRILGPLQVWLVVGVGWLLEPVVTD